MSIEITILNHYGIRISPAQSKMHLESLVSLVMSVLSILSDNTDGVGCIGGQTEGASVISVTSVTVCTLSVFRRDHRHRSMPKFDSLFLQSTSNGFLANLHFPPLQDTLNVTCGNSILLGSEVTNALIQFSVVARGRSMCFRSLKSFDWFHRLSQYCTVLFAHLTAFATAFAPSMGPIG